MILVLLVCTACKGKPPDQKVDASTQNERVTTVEESPEPAVRNLAGIQLPDGFPDDVFVADGAEVTAVVHDNDQYQVDILVDGELEGLASLWESKMQTSGWLVREKIVTEQKAQMKFAKASGKRGALVDMQAGKPLNNVRLTVSELKE